MTSVQRIERPFSECRVSRGDSVLVKDLTEMKCARYISGPVEGGLHCVHLGNAIAWVDESRLFVPPMGWVDGIPVYSGNCLHVRGSGELVEIISECDGQFLCKHKRDHECCNSSVEWIPRTQLTIIDERQYHVVAADRTGWIALSETYLHQAPEVAHDVRVKPFVFNSKEEASRYYPDHMIVRISY